MIERLEEGKRYRWTHSEPGYAWNKFMREGLMGRRVALCTLCTNSGWSAEFDIVSGGMWSYSTSENEYFEEVKEEYL